jgi:hypothetical protein
MIPNLGRIQEVPLREVWDNEATSFTPWLLQNEDVLSELLGIDITLERREESVGRFSLDLIGRNNDDGSTVIVENQLEGTDHSHLGQLLTYAGGLDAHTIIWVASEFRDEHRAALDWLNRVTGENTHFFGVVVRAVRIGDSVAAPDLTLVVEPNDFGKVVRARSESRWMEERGTKYQEFWARIMERLQDDFPEFKSRKAPTRQYLGLTAGYSGSYRTIAFSRSKLKVELYLGASDADLNSARLEALYERKTEIEREFGEPLSWEELEGRKAARFAFYREASILNESEWEDYFSWVEKYFTRLSAVAQLDAFHSAMSQAD